MYYTSRPRRDSRSSERANGRANAQSGMQRAGNSMPLRAAPRPPEVLSALFPLRSRLEDDALERSRLKPNFFEDPNLCGAFGMDEHPHILSDAIARFPSLS